MDSVAVALADLQLHRIACRYRVRGTANSRGTWLTVGDCL